MDEEDKTTVAICDTGSNYESGLYGLTLSLNPPATMWAQRSNGVTIRYPIGRRQKVIFINKGRTDSVPLGGKQKTIFISESSLIFDDWTISRLDDRRWREEEAGEALN